jgi:hypothetical protein
VVPRSRTSRSGLVVAVMVKGDSARWAALIRERKISVE